MAGISSAGQHSLLLQNTLRNQERLALTQEQITTGKKASDFQQLSPDVQKALDTRQALSGVEGFRSTIQTVQRQVDTMDLHLGASLDAARDLKQSVLDALGQQNGDGLNARLEETFDRVVGALNARVDGNFIFAGARTDQQPVTVSSVGELQALADAGEAFQNDDQRRRAVIAEGEELEFGQLADDVGQEILASIKRIADFNDNANGNNPDGPLEGKLTDNQIDFLEAEFAKLETAIESTQNIQSENGITANRLSDTDERHSATENFLKEQIGEIEDVNLAEAVTRLNQQQTTLEASFRAIGTLSNLSLLDFL